MEDNKTYFGEIGHGLKTLAIGMKTTWRSSTPRTARRHFMWQSAIVDA